MKKCDVKGLLNVFLRNRVFPFGLVLVIMCIQLFALTIASNWQKVDVYNDRANTEIDKCIADAESIAERAKVAMIHMKFDDEILWAVQQSELTPLEQQRLFLNLKTYKNFSKEIKNIYIFKESNSCIYSTVQPCKQLAEFPFLKTKELLQNGYAEKKMLVIIDKSDYMAELYGNEVVRFVMQFDELSNSVVMVDIDVDAINEVFRRFKKSFGGTTYIKLSKNEYMYDGNDGEFPPAALINVGVGENRAMRSYNGEKYLVIHKTIKGLGTDVFGIIPKKCIKTDAFTTRVLVMINIAIVFLIILLGSMGLLFKFLRDNAKKHANELEKLKNNDVREAFLKEHQPVISCFKCSDAEAIEECKKYISSFIEMDETKKIALVRIDFHNLSDRGMVSCGKYTLMKLVEEIFKQTVTAFAVYEQDDFVLLLLGKVEVDYIAKCRKAYSDCKMALKNHNVEASCYVSDTAKVEDISEIYSEVSSLAEYMFIYNRPMFIDYSLVIQRALESDDWVNNDISGIKNNIMIPNEETALLLETFINNLRRLGVKEAKQAVHALYLAIGQCVEQIRNENTKFKFDLVPYFPRFSMIKSLDEARDLFVEIIEQIQEQYVEKENEGGKYNLIVKRAYEVIEKNLYDVSLCRSMVADELGISKSHLSRVFKETTGISLSDIINDLRLKATAELLISTNKSIKEIITEVGIVNPSYFTVMFKKRYGMSPSEYRIKKNDLTKRDSDTIKQEEDL